MTYRERASGPCVSPGAYSGTGITIPNFNWAKNAQLRTVHGVEPKRSPEFRIPEMCHWCTYLTSLVEG